MTTFTRIPLAYWADRVGFPILMSGIGLFILILILVKGQDGLGSLENVLSLLLSLALVIFGIFFFGGILLIIMFAYWFVRYGRKQNK